MADWVVTQPGWRERDEEDEKAKGYPTDPVKLLDYPPPAPEPPAQASGSNWVATKPEWRGEFLKTGERKSDPSQDALRAHTGVDKAIDIGREVGAGTSTAFGIMAAAPTLAATKSPWTAYGVGASVAGGSNAAMQGLLDTADRWQLRQRGLEAPEPGVGQQAERAWGDIKSGASQYIAGEGMGNIIGPTMQGALAPNAEGFAQNKAGVAALEGMGAPVSPGMRTGSKLLSGLENMARKLPGFSGYMAKKDHAMFQALLERRNSLLNLGDPRQEIAALDREMVNIVDQIVAGKQGASRNQINAIKADLERRFASGQPISEANLGWFNSATARSQSLRNLKNRAYDRVDELIPSVDDSGARLSNEVPNFLSEARAIRQRETGQIAFKDKELIAEMDLIVGREAGESGATAAPRAITDQNTGLTYYELPDGRYSVTPPAAPEAASTDWQSLQTFMGRLNDAIRDANPQITTGASGASGRMTDRGRMLTRLKNALEMDMDEIAVARGGQQARGRWDAAKAINKQYKELFDSDFWHRLSKNAGDPEYLEGVANSIFSNPGTLREAERLGGREAVQNVRKAWTKKQFDSAFDTMNQQWNPEAVAKIFSKADPQMLESMYGRDGVRAIFDGLKGATDLKKVPVEFWESMPKQGAVRWILSSSKPDRMREVLPMLRQETRDGIKSEFLLMNLGGEGNTLTAGPMGNLNAEIVAGQIPRNVRRMEEVGKMLFPEGEWVQVKEFSSAIKLLGEYNKAGYNPGSGVPVLQYHDIAQMLKNVPGGILNWTGRNLVAKAYYSDWLKNIVTRRLASPEQARRWGNLIGKYLGTVGGAAVGTNLRGDNLPATQRLKLEYEARKKRSRVNSVPPGPNPKAAQEEAIMPQTLGQSYGWGGGFQIPAGDQVMSYDEVTRFFNGQEEEY